MVLGAVVAALSCEERLCFSLGVLFFFIPLCIFFISFWVPELRVHHTNHCGHTLLRCFFQNIFMLVGTLTLFPYFFSWPCLLALRISVKLLLLCYPLPTYPALSILTLFPSPLLSIRLSRIVMLYHFFHAAFEASCVGTLSPVFYKRAHPLCLFHIQQYPPLL